MYIVELQLLLLYYTSANALLSRQPSVGMASVSIVEPALQLLRSLHVDVQHEGELPTVHTFNGECC